MGIVILLTLYVGVAYGHRNGCHSNHSCASDSGSYTCGDFRNCSYCMDNQYCKNGIPSNPSDKYQKKQTMQTVTSSKMLKENESRTCDTSLWDHVYHPKRLQVLQECKSVSGIIESIKSEKDGDLHIRLKLDSQYANLLTRANYDHQKGNMVLEPICQKKVSQKDAISSCISFDRRIVIPPVGSHVRVVGSYVLDLEHGSWAEIHPVTSFQKIP